MRRDLMLAGLTVPTALLRSTESHALAKASVGGGPFNVRAFGAVGDGTTIDSPAVNKAIEHAATKGGGTIYFPAGTYACYSIRLKSNTTLYLDAGAVILAASATGAQGYDEAESLSGPAYQDYGHSHWHNSLIWAEGAKNVAILGPGLIWGRGLSRGHRVESDPS